MTQTMTAPLPLPLLKQVDLQKHFRVSDWTVNKWVRDGCPVERLPNGHRRFDLAQVYRWKDEELAKNPPATAEQSAAALRGRSI